MRGTCRSRWSPIARSGTRLHDLWRRGKRTRLRFVVVASVLGLALLVDVYHEFRHPREMLRSIRRSLKSNGALVLVEYRKEDPSIPIADTHKMSVADARTEVEAEGFTFDRLVPGLPRQHIIVFRK